ncbi:MAG TPA: hypothetical protein VJU81_04365 [Methylomirabilota bacterium]|nr:hypothetical protein [Methylomirabilota bacterium]
MPGRFKTVRGIAGAIVIGTAVWGGLLGLVWLAWRLVVARP